MNLALAWLLLSLPLAILIGKCTSTGQSRDAIRQAAQRQILAAGNCLSRSVAPAVEEQPLVPAQNSPDLAAQEGPLVPTPRQPQTPASTAAA